MTSYRYDVWDVNGAAEKLIAQAHTLSTRHLPHGVPRMQFNQEVAWYAKRIADDVAQGRKTPEQGIQALLREQRDLLIQAQVVTRKGPHAIVDSIERMPTSRLTQPGLKPDSERLLRHVHAQNLKTNAANTANSVEAAPSPHPVPDLNFFPRERWPAPLPEPEQPGFYIVPKSTTAEELEAQLFSSASPAVIAKFKTLNPNLDQVKAGSMIVLSDPNNQQCTYEEALLMQAASTVNKALEPLSPEEADFMAQHYNDIAFYVGKGSLGVGAGLAMFGKHLDDVGIILREIEALHTRTFQAEGRLKKSPGFYAERKRLLTKLDTQLTRLTRKSIGLPDHPNLKIALGISNKSLVHRWRKAGAAGQIPGYATHIEGISKASQYVKYGGWIGTAVGGGASAIKVQGVCAEGNVEACKKVKFTEAGSFAGGFVVGGAAGSLLAGSAGAAICIALGAPTAGAGTLLCGVVLVGVSSFIGGLGGEKIGEALGERIYEANK
ncbi:hypothetical protein [Pseudomonas moorei]|uniref:hypothetical protein n=1 Tax=Pseudomonas moorei TaxID=395599 RepID=UPI00200BADFE